MVGLSKDIEDALVSVIEGLRYPVNVTFIDEDKLQRSLNSKVTSFQSAKKLLQRWVSSDNAPSKSAQRHYAEELIDAGTQAISNLREGLGKGIDFDTLDPHKFDIAIKAKPSILEAIFDIDAAMLELKVQLQDDKLDFGDRAFKIGYPERYAKGEFFPKENYHKTYLDDKEDAVIICPKGTKGELITISELKIWLPKPPRDRKEILFNDRHRTEQYWRRQEPPANISPENSDKFHDYILEEFRRRREGIWFMNAGTPTYLTGNMYFALQHCKMLDDGGYMDFRFAQWGMYIHAEACLRDKRCLGQLFLKSRRTGFTYMVLTIMLNEATSTRNMKAGITSKTGEDAESAFTKFSYMHNSLPFYLRPVVKGKEDSLTELFYGAPLDNTKVAKKSRKIDTDFYLNTHINWKAAKDGSYDSEKLGQYLCDEAFKREKPQNILTHLGMISPALMPNGTVVGKAWVGSTMNARNKGGEEGIALIKLSQVRDRDPMTKQTPTGLYFHFLAAQDNMERYTDKFGKCHITKPSGQVYNVKGELITEGSIDYLLAKEASLKGDDIALNERYRTYPRTIAHAMRDEASNSTFNITKLQDQLEYTQANKDVTSGNFEWVDKVDGDVEWHPSPKGRFKVSWIPSDVDDTMYLRNNVRKVGDKFYPMNDEIGAFGCDPFSIKSTVGQGSKGAIHGKTRINASGAPSNKFFLEYIARPSDENIFFEDVIKACRFYGMPVLVESNRIDLLRYMRNRGYRGFSMNRLDKPTAKLNPNEVEYGGQTMSGKDIIDSHMNAIGSWIEKYVGLSTNEGVRPLGEMGEMPFEETLLDWLAFNPDPGQRTKHDATISSGLSIMACTKEKYKPVPKKKDTAKSTGFLKKYSNKGDIGVLKSKSTTADDDRYLY